MKPRVHEKSRTQDEIDALNAKIPDGMNPITFLRSRYWTDQITPAGRFQYWKKRDSNDLWATWDAIEEELAK